MSNHPKYDSVLVAKFVLAIANESALSLNATQLQKLLFIVYGNYLAVYGESFITEHPRVWPFGPVFPRVQKKINIAALKDLRPDDQSLEEINQDENIKLIIQRVIETYSHFSAKQLSDWSHSPGSPWDKTRTHPDFNWNYEIPDSYIKDYFAQVNV